MNAVRYVADEEAPVTQRAPADSLARLVASMRPEAPTMPEECFDPFGGLIPVHDESLVVDDADIEEIDSAFLFDDV